MNTTSLDIRSHLFTVQVHREKQDNGQHEWCGKVQHVHSGEAFYFSEWTTLVAAVVNKLTEAESHTQENRKSLTGEG